MWRPASFISSAFAVHQVHYLSVHHDLISTTDICHNADRGDSPGEVWYAELLLLFSFKTRSPIEPEVAFVRCFHPARRPAHAKHIILQAFQYAKIRLAGIQAKVFQTDVVTLASITGPCFMQPVPISGNVFYFNHWVGNTANAIQ